jgi:hypothetical protein
MKYKDKKSKLCFNLLNPNTCCCDAMLREVKVRDQERCVTGLLKPAIQISEIQEPEV